MTEMHKSPTKKPLRRRMLGHPLTHLIAVLVLLGLTQNFIVKIGMVPSRSMQQTLEVGDRVLINRLAYVGDRSPTNGDIVVFSTDQQL